MGDFWRDKAAWPRDTPEMVFLGRAIDVLGRSFYDEEWTGEEATAETFDLFDIVPDPRKTNNFIARHLPQFGRRAYNGSMAPPPPGEDEYRPDFKFSEDEYKQIGQFIERHNKTVPSAKARFKRVQDTIASAGVSGELETFFFKLSDPKFYSIPSNWWIASELGQRFATCSINPAAPFKGAGLAWIFVSRVDFAKISPATATRANGPRQRRGAPPKYDWDDGRLFVLKQLETKGDFDSAENQAPDWRSQNDLIDRLLQYMGREGEEPGRSTAQGYVSTWVLEWRAGAQ